MATGGTDTKTCVFWAAASKVLFDQPRAEEDDRTPQSTSPSLCRGGAIAIIELDFLGNDEENTPEGVRYRDPVHLTGTSVFPVLMLSAVLLLSARIGKAGQVFAHLFVVAVYSMRCMVTKATAVHTTMQRSSKLFETSSVSPDPY